MYTFYFVPTHVSVVLLPRGRGGRGGVGGAAFNNLAAGEPRWVAFKCCREKLKTKLERKFVSKEIWYRKSAEPPPSPPSPDASVFRCRRGGPSSQWSTVYAVVAVGPSSPQEPYAFYWSLVRVKLN